MIFALVSLSMVAAFYLSHLFHRSSINRTVVSTSRSLHQSDYQRNLTQQNSERCDTAPLLVNSQLSQSRPKRIVVAMTGATGAILGIEVLKALRTLGVETHLILSHWALETIRYETSYTASQVRKLATHSYSVNDAAAAPSSGSFQTDGMIIVPCSMKTLSAIRHGYGADLVARSADVNIKEQRKLVMCVRETPLSSIHLKNMLGMSKIPGVVVFPPVPAFYTRPESVDDIVKQSVGRMIDALGFDCGGFQRWGEDGAGARGSSEAKGLKSAGAGKLATDKSAQ